MHDNKQIIRRLFEEGFNREDNALVDALVAPEYVDAAGARGPGAFQQVMARLRGAFPDIHYTVDELVAEGERVAVGWSWSGTHLGVFRGVAPTQRTLTNKGLAVFRLREGRVVSATLHTDRLGFLQAIGVVPSDERLFTTNANP